MRNMSCEQRVDMVNNMGNYSYLQSRNPSSGKDIWPNNKPQVDEKKEERIRETH